MSNRATRQQRRTERQRKKSGPAFSPTVLAAIAGGAAILIVAALVMFWPGGDAEASFEPVESIEYEYSPNHLHGIGYDPDNDRIYLASHFGLFAREGDQLFQVGDERSDLMGFSMNPEDPTEIFVSGHPQGGGNLGLLYSTDEGLTYEQIFSGVADEVVDFHAMTISAADPDYFYGAFMGQIYRSQNRGHDFVAFEPEGLDSSGLCWGVPCLAASSDDPETVFAGTQQGLLISIDGGESWEILNSELGQVAAVAAHPSNPDRLVAYTEAMGLAVSEDRGQTWESRQGDMPVTEGGFVFAIALNPDDDDQMFAATMNNEVFETTDGGETWHRIV